MRDFSFEKNNSTFFDKIIAKLRYKKVFSFCKKNNLSINGKIICDVGCGYKANLLSYLYKNYINLELYGIDLNISKNINYINFIEANLEKDIFNINSSTMDIVFSLAVIEHLENPSLYLSEIKRILKPGGKLVMTTPSIYGKPVLEFLAYTGIGTKEEILDHKIYYNKKTLFILIKKYFNNINIKYFQFGLNIILIVKK